MNYQERFLTTPGDHRALPVVVLGVLVAALPLIILPSPGDGGPVTIAVRIMQGIAVGVGLGVIATGIYSYSSGNLRPAVATATAVIGLAIVGAIGGLIETSGGPLIPIWAWLLASILMIGVSIVGTYRFVGVNTVN